MSEPKYCPHCGKPVPAEAPGNLCPECTLKAGLATQAPGDDPSGNQTIVVPPEGAPAIDEIRPHFPQLEILEYLGRGGMGLVYKARQPKLDRVVALKILAPERGADPQFADRFLREAQTLARLNHPNIVTIHDFGEAGGLFYLVMEFVDGVTLRELLRHGRVAPDEALAIVPKICEALQFAHQHGIIHRDIKPENILLDRQGRVKIADFGIAKLVEPEGQRANLTAEQQVIGTPHYMAPEQVEQPHRVDHRADIYSLGVVFYELLTGELPLGKFQPPSQKVQVDVRLDDVVLRALAKEPERRYQQASQVKTAVESLSKSEGEIRQAQGEDLEPELEGGAGGSGGTALVAGQSSGGGDRVRLSRAALIGAIWAPWFVLSALPLFILRAETAAEHTGPSWWQLGLTLAVLAVGLTAPFGTTILGWIGVSQIRRSNGRLYGLGLAVTDGLFYPLLLLDGLVFFTWYLAFRWLGEVWHPDGTAQDPVAFDHLLTGLWILASVVSSALADYLVVRAVWRGLTGVGPRRSVRPPDEGTAAWTRRAALLGLAGLVWLAVWSYVVHLHDRPGILLTNVGGFAALEVAAFFCAVKAWRHPLGKLIATISAVLAAGTIGLVGLVYWHDFVLRSNSEQVTTAEMKRFLQTVPYPMVTLTIGWNGSQVSYPDLMPYLVALRRTPQYEEWLQVRNNRVFNDTNVAGFRFAAHLAGIGRNPEQGIAVELIPGVDLYRPDGSLLARMSLGASDVVRWDTAIYDGTGTNLTARLQWKRDEASHIVYVQHATQDPGTDREVTWAANRFGVIYSDLRGHLREDLKDAAYHPAGEPPSASAEVATPDQATDDGAGGDLGASSQPTTNTPPAAEPILAGRVVDPNGNRFAGAKVVWCTPSRRLFITDGRVGDRTEGPVVKTDDEGRFVFPGKIPNEANVVAVSDRGFAWMTAVEFAQSRFIKLSHWGKLACEVKVGKNVVPGKTINLMPGERRNGFNICVSYEYSTAARDGKCMVEEVPPGWIEAGFMTSVTPAFTSLTGRRPFYVKSGQVSHLTIGGEGRPLIGKFVAPSDVRQNIDFESTEIASLYRARPPIPYPTNSPSLSEDQQQAWLAQWNRSAQGQQFWEAHFHDENYRHFTFRIQKDGAFRIEDVPPGKYEMMVQIGLPNDNAQGNGPRPLTGYKGEIIVPVMDTAQSDEPLNLGSLALQVHQ